MLRLLLLVCLLVLSPGLHAAAQIGPDDARRALDVLQDPVKRDQLVATLRAIAQAPPAAQPEAPPATPALPLAPGGLGAQVLVGASGGLNRLSDEMLATVGAVRSVPQLWFWLRVTATDPAARGILLDSAWRLALVLAIGLAVEWGLRWAVRRPILALVRQAPNGEPPPEEEEEEDGVARAESGETEAPHRRRIAALMLLRRIPLVLGRLVLELLPVLGFLAVTHLVAATALGGAAQVRLVLLAMVAAYALCAAIMCVMRMLFSPGERRLRLLSVSDASAAYATRWTRRIVVVSVFGYALAEVGVLLGLSQAAHDALLKAVALADLVFLAVIVLQRRRTVRRLLRAPEDASGPIAALRNRVARIWHWLALAALAALWLAGVVEVQHGYSLMLRYLVGVVVVVVVTRLAQILLLGALDRALLPRDDVEPRHPGLAARLVIYHPMLSRIMRALIVLAGAIALLQIWGLGTFDWLVASALGRRLVSSLFALAVTVLLAVVVWEAVNAAIEHHLERLTREAQAARSARLRTLLPLLRTTLAVCILIVAGMMALSEVGVNIGPLLAGAGIVGVAIGFGSQKLVQDLITGIFLLLENAMQVGDAVTVSGLAGTVENLSVRTIRLRAADGSVHIVPFSAVTTVSNANRGLGNASVSVVVAAGEDTDRVCAALTEIAAGMRGEPDFAPRMLSDLQLWGVDRVDGASATIAGQVVCTDSGRWSVQREFNRRMKRRFDELGIRLYNPTGRMVEMRQITDERERDEPACRHDRG